MTKLNQDVSMFSGDTHRLNVTVDDGAVPPVALDITGFTIWWQAARQKSDGRFVKSTSLQKDTLGGGVVITDGPNGQFQVVLSPADTEGISGTFYHEAQLRWKLSNGACAIIQQLYGDINSAQALAEAVKSCRIPLSGARPIDEVISTSGGVAWSELDQNLMLKKLPHVYCAGEMIDWEAPTGGFLMQGCFATGTVAGLAAAQAY